MPLRQPSASAVSTIALRRVQGFVLGGLGGSSRICRSGRAGLSSQAGNSSGTSRSAIVAMLSPSCPRALPAVIITCLAALPAATTISPSVHWYHRFFGWWVGGVAMVMSLLVPFLAIVSSLSDRPGGRSPQQELHAV